MSAENGNTRRCMTSTESFEMEYIPKEPTGTEGAPFKAEEIKPLKVLICSANVGNREPTPESIAAWIPADGSVNDVKRGSVNGDNDDNDSSEEYFDIIAIGMQEAAFEMKEDSDLKLIPKLRSKLVLMGKELVSAVEEDESETSLARDQKINHIEESQEDRSESSEEQPESSRNLGSVMPLSSPTRETVKKVAATVPKVLIGKPVAFVHSNIRSVAGSEDHTREPLLSGAIFVNDETHSAELYGGDTRCLHLLLKERCPSYQFTVMFLRGEMRLIILVRENIVSEVSDVDYRAKNTGIGTVLANKGGIVATLTIRGTRLAFVTAHLEAHEGIEHYENRCANITDILGGAKVGPRPRYYDVSLYAHHTFVCGDLNYRIVLPELPSLMPHDEQVEFTKEIIEREDWGYLHHSDELAKALREKDCLVGFQTLPCHFHPTFKVARTEGWVYNSKRIPSYTDRILWKSLDGLEGKVKPFAYHPCPGFITSDHKPIRGAFLVTPFQSPLPGSHAEAQRRPRISLDRCGEVNSISERSLKSIDTNGNARTLHLFVSEIRAELSPMEGYQSLNPFIMFLTNPMDLLVLRRKGWRKKVFGERLPAELLYVTDEIHDRLLRKRNKMWPHTSTRYKTSQPTWRDTEIHLELNNNINSAEQLSGAFLYITIFHADPAADILIGTVVLNAQRLVSSPSSSDSHAKMLSNGHDDNNDDLMHMIELENEPILKNGRIRGYFSCQLVGWWLDNNANLIELSSRNLRHGAKLKMNRKECSIM